MSSRFARLALGAACILFAGLSAVAADDNPQAEVVVIGTVPLPGIGLPLDQIPSNVQTGRAVDLKRQQSLDITEYLNNNFSGISISESQDNPFQADINYHGFTASPLLGTPQGLSVYVDGVRINEAFGDTVNWDLIPESAISTLSLISGSNPVFGLNTLGGALALQMKNGHTDPGTEFQAWGGMFNRRSFEGETGGSVGAFDYFATANFFDETGWRDLSPSKVEQFFGNVGYATDETNVHLNYTWAHTQLVGNGTTPESLLAVRYQDIYSAPDFTNNNLNFLNATGSQNLLPELVLSGNLYYRHLVTHSNNGDINDDNYLSDDYGGPDIDCSAAYTSLLNVAYCANGINRASTLVQKTWGAGVQLTDIHDFGTMKNQAVVGLSYDRATQSYTQAFQYATLTPDRATVPIIDPNNPLEPVNVVGGLSKTFGAYFTDTFSPNDLLHFTVAARYNRITETLGGYSVDTDVGDDAFNDDLPLSGDPTYSRVNPSVGFTVTPSKQLTIYGNYNESTRAPTIIELGCSDPAQPCGLPNDFASDPNLSQVISRTFEVGVRGSLPSNVLDWSVDVFHTQNSNDIQYVATTISEGYFSNVGSTRRQGLDLAFGGKIQAFTWHAVYSFVDATYRSTFLINAESNSTADPDTGNIQVNPGNRIPLIPRHTGRLRLDYAFSDKFEVGGSVISSAGSYLHGDENNANVPDGVTVLGSGKIGGYTVVNLEGTYHPASQFDLFVKVTNLFNKRYSTAGFLTDNTFNPDGSFRPDPDTWTNENATSPAQPISVFGGFRLRL